MGSCVSSNRTWCSSHSSSSLSSSSGTGDHLPRLFRLITDGNKWGEIRSILKSKRGPSLCQQKDCSNLNCLSLAVAYKAPLDIIELIHKVSPSLIFQTDIYGATPLHFGCLNDASLESIKFLIREKKDLVMDLDFDNKSALHHAVECACGKILGIHDFEELSGKVIAADSNANANVVISNSKSDGERIASQNVSFLASYINVINELCKAAPQMVHVQNDQSATPIDLIQLYKANQKPNSEKYFQLDGLYKILSGTSVQVYLHKKKMWEVEGIAARSAKSRKGTFLARGLPGQDRTEGSSSLSSKSCSSFSSI